MQYDALDDRAKEKARQWMHECVSQEWTGEVCLEYCTNALNLLGFKVNERAGAYRNGEQEYERDYRWQLSYGQGDGLVFGATWKADDVEADKVLADYAPDSPLHGIAARLMALVILFPTGRCHTLLEGHHGVPSANVYCFDWACDPGEEGYMDDDAIKAMQDIVDDLNRWVFNELKEDYEADTDDESLVGSIEANEYEFNEDGVIL